MKTKILLFLLTVSTLSLFAQQDTFPQEPTKNLQLIAKNTGQEIILRWAPTTPSAWESSNVKGYQVERAIYDFENQIFPDAFESLTNEPIKPWPLEDWRQFAESGDEYAAVAAQAIYGTTFTNGRNGKAESNVFLKNQEFENRHSFALLAADFSADAAEASGLRFVDTDVQANKVYRYRVYSLGNSPTYPIDTAYVTVRTNQVKAATKPTIGSYKEGEHSVTLIWNKAAHTKHFTAFFIERSKDGINFQSLTDKPYLSSVPGAEQNFIFMDSLSENYQPHYYRLRGLTAFGNLSEPSESIQAMGRDRTPPPNPLNLRATPTEDRGMRLDWEYPENTEALEGFFIGRSQHAVLDFEYLNEQALSSETREYLDLTFDETQANYYIVVVQDTAGNRNISLVVNGFIADDQPPVAPTGLQGSIDKKGHLELHWAPSPELDVTGYKLLYANAADHVFTPIHDQILRDTFFKTSIASKTLTEKIYFKIQALDVSFNQSDFSEVLILDKPDLVPPAAPVFKKIEKKNKAILISWHPSKSKDVTSHQLFRRTKGVENWTRLGAFKNANQFEDKVFESGQTYEYRLLAIDDATWATEAPTQLLVSIPASTRSTESNLTVAWDKTAAQVNLRWTLPNELPTQTILYRAVAGGGFSKYQKLKGTDTTFQDKAVKNETSYQYRVAFKFENGMLSNFSVPMEVTVVF